MSQSELELSKNTQKAGLVTGDLSSQEVLEKFGYQQELKRALTLPMLIAYGINWVAPLGPAVIFGFMMVRSGGTVALPFLLSGIVMLFTAAAYASLSPNFPLAGSAYNYVSKGMSPYIGFLLGWVMIMDYVFFPTSTTMSTAAYVNQAIPSLPYVVILIIMALVCMIINIIGVEVMAKLGFWLLALGIGILSTSFVVILWAVGVWDVGTGTIFSTWPFHFDTFNGLVAATSLAVFNYLGYDAVTTLSEESHNPVRDIPKAVYWTVIGAMIMFTLTGYIGTLAVPNWKELAEAGGQQWIDTALLQINKIAGGEKFGIFYAAGYVTNMMVFNIVSTAAASRLLYGMGRDNLLPKQIFGVIGKKFRTPHWNIVTVTSLIFILATLITIEQVSYLINFGALAGFVFINITSWYVFYFRKDKVKHMSVTPDRTFLYFLRYAAVPFVGFAFCLWMLISLGKVTHIVGLSWLAVGVVILAIKTSFFRKLPPEIHES